MSGVFGDSTLWWSVCITSAAAIGAAVYVFFGPESFISRPRVSRCPGLTNLGNTCFINAILQSLAATSLVRAWLEVNKKRGHLIKSLDSILTDLNESDEYCIDPIDVLNALKCHRWEIDFRQQDALELYHVLLTTIEEELSEGTCSLSDIIELVTNDNNTLAPNSSLAKTKLGSFSAPHRSKPCPLRGLLTSTLACSSCGNSLPTRYEFVDSLSLPLNRYAPFVTLRTCLKNFMSTEMVQDVECPSCSKANNAKGIKCKRSFVKQVRFGRLPDVLCLSIIRTTWEVDGSMGKNSAHVQFPVILDVSEFLTPGHDNTSYKYQLRAVVEHLGGPTSGHYCTYKQCRREWVYTSDSLVYPMPLHDVLKCQAYMLFYQKIT